ncbi:sodium/calcium exchanger 2 [Patella vulgata]|uniref:sodium/calcium exchanger 2 n=1 Tax=Patella vulgata TaxID=6465 RepID=UPI00218095D4|nr:sodium/calcium exchanger 2 [Patella vulgata]XP_050390882.1 sodium/calcium exchanger 2 [Patella vulgata]XP_050390883.1 sodium/calcium exchanger 2 [Patella vulgata]
MNTTTNTISPATTNETMNTSQAVITTNTTEQITTNVITTIGNLTTSTITDQNNSTMSMSTGYMAFDPFNYRCSKALLLPVISEATWNPGVRAFLYLVALLWCFLAVAIIADIFMCSIEKITSKTRKIRVALQGGGAEVREVKVWNDTVANLSLLALGTSAPEILLSVIEIVGNNFQAGDLGPGTIVGSASFNLLVISAICIMSIPGGDVRRINNMKVFAVTAFSCIFAYVWLIIVLVGISPGRVEIWEAFITLLFFPLLIVIAFLAEKNFFIKCKQGNTDNRYTVNDEENTGMALSDRKSYYQDASKDGEPKGKDNPSFDDIEVNDAKVPAIVIEHHEHETDDEDNMHKPKKDEVKNAAKLMMRNHNHNSGYYRINAIRRLSGSKRIIPTKKQNIREIYDLVKLSEKATRYKDASEGGVKPVIEFTSPTVAVLESQGQVRIGIRRSGNIAPPVSVRVETGDGSAQEGSDYKEYNDIIHFAANEELQEVFIDIIDDDEWEEDEIFFVRLSAVPGQVFAFGEHTICEVTIIDDDEPGLLRFAKPSIIVRGSASRIKIPVQRVNGADGNISVKWKTKDISAKHGKDYDGGEGELKFVSGETNKFIVIPLLGTNNEKRERDDSFEVELGQCTGGAELGKLNRTIVTIVNDKEFVGMVGRIMSRTFSYLDEIEDTSYIDQFKNAMNVNGGNIEEATFVDYIFHFLTFIWKIIFAFIPPVHFLGGWPTFLISLAMIGFLTALIGDLASLFGCLIGLEDSITAITLVALGTSMPDTFASKTAALMERYADSSVGNVTGSNSVNVFLGLGLPWVIASIYWEAKGSTFQVPVGSLVFSVILYTIAAVIALSLLVIRRNVKFFGNAELGGPTAGKITCGVIFITLWVLYVLFSALQAKKIISFQI